MTQRSLILFALSCAALALAHLAPVAFAQAPTATSQLTCGPGNWNGCSTDSGSGICDATHVECSFWASACQGNTSAVADSNAWCNTWCNQTYTCRPASIRCNSDADCLCGETCLAGFCDESVPRGCGTPPDDEPGDGGGCRGDRDCPFGQACTASGCCNSCPAGRVWASPVPPSINVRAQCIDFPVRPCEGLSDCPIDERCRAVFGFDGTICMPLDQQPLP